MHVQFSIARFGAAGLQLERIVKLDLFFKVNICNMSRSKRKPCQEG